MKKTKTVKKEKTDKIISIKQEPKREDRNGFLDPISAQCYRCENQFWIKWVIPQKDYAKKNNWNYWDEKEINKNLKICNSCLRLFYLNERQEFLSTVKNLKKRNNLVGYIRKEFV